VFPTTPAVSGAILFAVLFVIVSFAGRIPLYNWLSDTAQMSSGWAKLIGLTDSLVKSWGIYVLWGLVSTAFPHPQIALPISWPWGFVIFFTTILFERRRLTYGLIVNTIRTKSVLDDSLMIFDILLRGAGVYQVTYQVIIMSSSLPTLPLPLL
jgi:hypothetical protein